MADFEFRLQQLSMGMSDGVITQWYKGEGDQVFSGEPIAEVDTGKVTQDIESPESGTISRIVAAPDEPQEIGAVLCVIKVAD